MGNNNYLQNSQGILSIGYIYLVGMGILNETLFYNQLGVSILNYSTILDVLISPISKMTSSIFSLLVFNIMIFSILILPKWLAKKYETTWFKKMFTLPSGLDENGTKKALSNVFIVFFAIMVFSFYIGTGVGSGYKTAQKIENNELEYNDKIFFLNGDVSDVAILGNNSYYVFYLSKDSKTPKVSPIQSAIKSIMEVK